MEIQLEHGPRRGTMTVETRHEEVWLRYLGGKSPNIRLMDALYTFSRTENGKTIFRYRCSREIPERQGINLVH